MWNVLIVDDDLRDRKHLVAGLEETAHCYEADNGEAALRFYHDFLMNDKYFDIILLDVAMPQQDGFSVLKEIRSKEEMNESESFKPAKIVMITTFKDSLMEDYNLGWDEFITKPVDMNILLDHLKTMLPEKKEDS